MSFWTAIVAIVAIVMIAGVFKSRRSSRRDYHVDNASNPAGPTPREKELESEVEELRERIHVLERIATDGREADRIASEIDKLRDE